MTPPHQEGELRSPPPVRKTSIFLLLDKSEVRAPCYYSCPPLFLFFLFFTLTHFSLISFHLLTKRRTLRITRKTSLIKGIPNYEVQRMRGEVVLRRREMCVLSPASLNVGPSCESGSHRTVFYMSEHMSEKSTMGLPCVL